MSTDITADPATVVYPDSDGQPMADNTLQWDWMVKIVGELREQFAGREVFVAGDLLWYPVQGDPRRRAAPDALVVFGRPPGYRGSYKQWEEGYTPPHVVFELLSPGNTADEMTNKFLFYNRYGVEEYYIIDPDDGTATGYRRQDDTLVPVVRLCGSPSPRLGTRFERVGDELKLIGPGGREFKTREERVGEIAEELRKTAFAFEDERTREVDAERRANAAEAAAADERAAKELLLAKLRELGVDPDAVLKPAG